MTPTFDNVNNPLTIAGSGSIEFGQEGGESFSGNGLTRTGNTLTISTGIEVVVAMLSLPSISGPLVNQGTIEANNGGMLFINDLLDNQGTILASNGSEISIDSDEYDPTDPTTLISWTNEGTLEDVSGSELIVGGSWTNASIAQ